MSTWDAFLVACAMMLVMEGALPFLSPRRWRAVVEQATRLRDGQLRFIGLSSLIAGAAVLLWVLG
ncbi:MAG TPA: DUF2065 domain-containing protein [Burkholderiaceae bacterium]|nr:DUF2065 domain-containing protein [Burkholderiaceae bacterium]